MPTLTIGNVGLVEIAYKSYLLAKEQTNVATAKLEDYKKNLPNTMNDLINFYLSQFGTHDIAMGHPSSEHLASAKDKAQVFAVSIIRGLTKKVNDASTYEEAKRQSYIGISAANNVPFQSTVPAVQINAESQVNDLHEELNPKDVIVMNGQHTAGDPASNNPDATGITPINNPTLLLIVGGTLFLFIIIIILKLK